MRQRVAIIGAGPAGLACAERLKELGDYDIHIFEQKPSAARKFLMAGKTGLNISHNEEIKTFISRYDHAEWLAPMIRAYDAVAIQNWMQDLGISSYIGSSGRIFPDEMKAAPLLRAWLKRLQDRDVRFFYRHQITSINSNIVIGIDLKSGQGIQQSYDAIVLACGAMSWPQLGSDGLWQTWLDSSEIEPFQASNVGVHVNWSPFMHNYFGQPLKRIQAWAGDEAPQFGEMVISHYGLEGGLVYRCNRAIRAQLKYQSLSTLYLDLLPDVSYEQLLYKLQHGKKQSLNTLWQKVGLDKTKIALVRDVITRAQWTEHERMAQYFKRLPITIQSFRPIEEAISCAGGIKQDAVDKNLMLKSHQNIFVCGEMLDWDAPTGGYLLTACLATGRWVGERLHQLDQS